MRNTSLISFRQEQCAASCLVEITIVPTLITLIATREYVGHLVLNTQQEILIVLPTLLKEQFDKREEE